jgi:hypothetical protein
MGLKFRRGSTAQQSGSLAFGEPYVNTTLGTLVVGGATGDIVLSAGGTGSTGNFGAISGSGLDITGNANIAGNVTVGGRLQIGDNTSDTLNVVSSLSSSLIPQTTNAFDLGSASKIWRDLYISTGSIKFVDGTTVVKELSLATISGLESATGSSNVSITNLNSVTASLTQRVAANEAVSGTFARTNSDNTFSGLQTFNNVNVNGTASFAYIQSTTGSSTSIGEAFIILNENTPSSNFAGIKVVDSGSSFTTASFVYDGLNNNWVFEKANVGSSDTSVAIFGPISTGGLGTEVGLTQNKLPKAVSSHGHHIGDSNITDSGTLITLGSNAVVNGTFYATGTTLVSGSSQITYASISSIPSGIVSGSSQISAGSTTGFATDVKTRLNAETVVSGSKTISGITLGSNLATLTIGTGLSGTSYNGSTGVTITNSGVTSITAGTGVSRDSATGTVTISIGQAVGTSDNVRFGSIGVGMNASGTSGRIDAANDIVAFSTSDIRLKENIVPIENALDKISKISGNTYDWKAELKDVHGYEGNDVGVIAQEIEAVLPQLVQDRDNGYKAVKYDKLVALLIQGIKEQQSQIEELKVEVEALKK